MKRMLILPNRIAAKTRTPFQLSVPPCATPLFFLDACFEKSLDLFLNRSINPLFGSKPVAKRAVSTPAIVAPMDMQDDFIVGPKRGRKHPSSALVDDPEFDEFAVNPLFGIRPSPLQSAQPAPRRSFEVMSDTEVLWSGHRQMAPIRSDD